MNALMRRCVGLVLLCAMLGMTVRNAQADELKNKAIEAGVGIGVAAAAITVVVVLLVTHKPSISGCAFQGADGLSLRNEGDGTTYRLRGDIASIAVGERVRVSGRRRKGNGPPEFDVAKLKKTFGPCAAVHG